MFTKKIPSGNFYLDMSTMTNWQSWKSTRPIDNFTILAFSEVKSTLIEMFDTMLERCFQGL
jgi:hypothetical protein